jgi:hypothetical protein
MESIPIPGQAILVSLQVNEIKIVSAPEVTAQELLRTQESQSPVRRIFLQKWIIRKIQIAGLKEAWILVGVIL